MLLLICILITSLFARNIDVDVDSNIVSVFGTNAKLRQITLSDACYYDDNSCYDIICNLFDNDDPYVTYVSVLPSVYYMNCTQIPDYRNVSMHVFGVRKMTKTSVKKCSTFGECLMKGCEIYNSDDHVLWFLLGGRC